MIPQALNLKSGKNEHGLFSQQEKVYIKTNPLVKLSSLVEKISDWKK